MNGAFSRGPPSGTASRDKNEGGTSDPSATYLPQQARAVQHRCVNSARSLSIRAGEGSHVAGAVELGVTVFVCACVIFQFKTNHASQQDFVDIFKMLIPSKNMSMQLHACKGPSPYSPFRVLAAMATDASVCDAH